MRLLICITLSALLFSCNKPNKLGLETGAEPKKATVIASTEMLTGVEDIELSTSFRDVALENARNIGEFFDHRVRFFKIDNPDITIGSGKVREVVLYFVDSALARIRYTLDADVSNQLMDSLGVSRFKPLDERSKELLASKNVWNKYKRQLHKDLRNYELVWRKPDAVTRFRVKKNDLDSVYSYLYYHEMHGYKKQIRQIEALYAIMDQAVELPDL